MAKNTVHCPICGEIMRTKYSKKGDRHTCLAPDCAYTYTSGARKKKTQARRQKNGRKSAHFSEYL
jgi:ssDNA-binding Zn-finger/Zn-ribbon topoisomerase 1